MVSEDAGYTALAVNTQVGWLCDDSFALEGVELDNMPAQRLSLERLLWSQLTGTSIIITWCAHSQYWELFRIRLHSKEERMRLFVRYYCADQPEKLSTIHEQLYL